MKNQLWAVGCGLGWPVGKQVWADYEQLLREGFSLITGQKKMLILFKNIIASALKSCIKKSKKNKYFFEKKNLFQKNQFFLGLQMPL